MSVAAAIVSGFMLGFATSIHCAGYCGAIAYSLALLAPQQADSHAAVARALLTPHLGRLAVYVAFGTTVAAAAAAIGTLVSLGGLRIAFQLLASAALAWTGVSIAGLLPESLGPDRLFAGLSTVLPSRRAVRSSSFAFGMAWGCAPCAMVYSALLNASVTGSPASGALFMLGFGIATVPPLAVVGAGLVAMRRVRLSGQARQAARRTIGLALVVMAIANAVFSGSGLSVLFCLTN
jgi:sulfite exporter TauE/SafE